MTKKEDVVILALLQQDINYIKMELADIKTKLDQNYITRAEFDPIKKIVYGMVGLILVAVVGGLVTLVVKK